jgi:ABC-type transporter Mla maintaining outer membrane lipid asymmetry permease subunit MlaE
VPPPLPPLLLLLAPTVLALLLLLLLLAVVVSINGMASANALKADGSDASTAAETPQWQQKDGYPRQI